MAKIIYTQEFDSIEEKEEFQIAVQARNMSIAINEIFELLRQYDKYGHSFQNTEEAIEKIRENIYEIVKSYNIYLE